MEVNNTLGHQLNCFRIKGTANDGGFNGWKRCFYVANFRWFDLVKLEAWYLGHQEKLTLYFSYWKYWIKVENAKIGFKLDI